MLALFKCHNCHTEVELLLPAQELEKTCPRCTQDLYRVYHNTAPAIKTDNTPRGKR